MALTERDKAILDFERTWWTEAGPKDTAIRERFELSGTRYYQLLTELVDDADALEYDPLAHPAPAPRARAPPSCPHRRAPDEPARRAIGETRPMARRRPSEPTANPARGAALVVVAVVIGLFLLREGLDTSEAVTTSSSDQGSDSSDSTDESPTAPTGTEDHHDHGRRPSARRGSHHRAQRLGGAPARPASTAMPWRRRATSSPTPTAPTPTRKATPPPRSIYFAPGFEEEAAAVAAAIGAPETVVPAPLPTTPPGPIAGASVVVVIGTDLANVTPPTVASGDTTTTTAAA